MTQPDFEKIRAQVKAINKLYGGKINIEEWTVGGEEILKVVMTFKQTDDSQIIGVGGITSFKFDPEKKAPMLQLK